jgi:hypothetical protein
MTGKHRISTEARSWFYEQEPPPCEKFKCEFMEKCKCEKIACKAFSRYAYTGKSLMRGLKIVKEGKVSKVVVVEDEPNARVYRKVFPRVKT